MKFFGKDEVLKIVDTRKSIVEFLTKESTLCPLIGSEIKMVEIGDGTQGIIFNITFPGMGNKKYVAKLISPLLGIDQNTGEKVRAERTESSVKCLSSEAYEFPKTNGDGVVVIPAESYLCDDETYSEYVLSVLVSEMYRKGECINFIDTFDFATCNSPIFKQYIFMDKIDDVLMKMTKCAFPESQPEVGMGACIQILFAIASYQQYKIVHGDLHLDNIFIEYITPETKFGGNLLSEADYFYYEIGGQRVYLSYTPYIIKIGDWGLSCKYSEPMVLNAYTVATGYDKWIPNYYNETYDAILALGRCVYNAQSNDDMQLLFAEMMGTIDNRATLFNYMNVQLHPQSKRQSPKYWDNEKFVPPRKLLTEGKSLEKYRKKPSGKGIRLGTLA